MLYPYLTIFSKKSNISISQNCIYFNTILFFSAFIFVATLQIPENFPENFQRDNRIVTYFSVENKNLERIILHISKADIRNPFSLLAHERSRFAPAKNAATPPKNFLNVFCDAKIILLRMFSLLLYIILCTIPEVNY